jgi:hypothetical protein
MTESPIRRPGIVRCCCTSVQSSSIIRGGGAAAEDTGRGGLLLAGLLPLLAPACRGSLRSRPDVVLIVIDTLRRDHLPFYGYRKDTAPFLGSLAARGAVFENAYSTTSWTAPATASLFTGMYPLQHGVVVGRFAVKLVRSEGVPMRLNRIPSRAQTIPEAMRARGYATHAVVQNANIRPELGFDQGFDAFHALNPSHRADTITEKLAELKGRILARRPYFLYLHYMDPHKPYNKNPPFFDPETEGDARSVSAYDSEIHHVDEHVRRSSRPWAGAAKPRRAHGRSRRELGERGTSATPTLFAETLNVPLLVRPGVLPGRRQPGEPRRRAAHAAQRVRGARRAGRSRGEPGRCWTGPAPALPERVIFADPEAPHGAAGPAASRSRSAAASSAWRRRAVVSLRPLAGPRAAQPDQRPAAGGSPQEAIARFEAGAPRLDPEFQDGPGRRAERELRPRLRELIHREAAQPRTPPRTPGRTRSRGWGQVQEREARHSAVEARAQHTGGSPGRTVVEGVEGQAQPIAPGLEERFLARPAREEGGQPALGDAQQLLALAGREEPLGQVQGGGVRPQGLQVHADVAIEHHGQERQAPRVREVEAQRWAPRQGGLAPGLQHQLHGLGRRSQVGAEDPAQHRASGDETVAVDLEEEARRAGSLVRGQESLLPLQRVGCEGQREPEDVGLVGAEGGVEGGALPGGWVLTLPPTPDAATREW